MVGTASAIATHRTGRMSFLLYPEKIGIVPSRHFAQRECYVHVTLSRHLLLGQRKPELRSVQDKKCGCESRDDILKG